MGVWRRCMGVLARQSFWETAAGEQLSMQKATEAVRVGGGVCSKQEQVGAAGRMDGRA